MIIIAIQLKQKTTSPGDIQRTQCYNTPSQNSRSTLPINKIPHCFYKFADPYPASDLDPDADVIFFYICVKFIYSSRAILGSQGRQDVVTAGRDEVAEHIAL